MSPPRRTRPSSSCTGTSRRWTRPFARSCWRARAGRPGERGAGAAAALREIGCDTTLVPTAHPVVDIVQFQQLTLDLADARGVDPDKIRRDDPRWERAAAAYD